MDLGDVDRVHDRAVFAALSHEPGVRRRIESCWDKLLGSMSIASRSSWTAWSRSLRSSRMRIRAGWPSVRKNSAFAGTNGTRHQ